MNKVPGLLFTVMGLLAFVPPGVGMDLSGNYSVRHAAEYAANLVHEGDDEDLRLATGMLDEILTFQETREGAAHRGNFLWESQSPVVQDLNAVEFTLVHLIPMMIESGTRLPEDLHRRLLKSIRLGLEEIRNLDVALTYTNIASMDCCNTCLGGELLGDPELAQRGYDRFRRFSELIIQNGNVFEFNSQDYTEVTLHALHLLKEHVQDPETRLLAKLMGDRLGLGIALKIHPETGRLAGPYSRSYYRNLIHSATPYAEIVGDWVREGVVSSWVGRFVGHVPLPYEIRETSVAEWEIGTTTYLSPSFSLGVSSKEVSRQTNPLVIRVDRGDKEKSDLVCSRYFMSEEDNKFYGDGKFFGVQEGGRAIGVYAPRGLEHPDSFAPATRHHFSSTKASLVWLDASNVDRIWVGGEEIQSLPHDLHGFETMVVETGPILIGIRPIGRTELGHESPVRWVRRGERLYFEIYNYLGPKKYFWDLDRASRFYKGQPYVAFYVEVVEKSSYENPLEFFLDIEGGEFVENVDPPFTSYRDGKERLARFDVTHAGNRIGLEIDLMEWTLKERWTTEGRSGWPMLESPWARQEADGRIEAASATIHCESQPALLLGTPEEEFWVMDYYGEPGPVEMVLPKGSVSIETMTLGRIEWDRGEVEIEAMEGFSHPKVEGGKLATKSIE